MRIQWAQYKGVSSVLSKTSVNPEQIIPLQLALGRKIEGQTPGSKPFGLRPKPSTFGVLTKGMIALYSLLGPVLHTASLLLQRRTRLASIPLLLNDMPSPDSICCLAGLCTATPVTPFRYSAGGHWPGEQETTAWVTVIKCSTTSSRQHI